MLDIYRIRGGFGGGERLDPIRWKKAYTRRTEWFLEHRLMISHFRCVLELAVRAAPDLELLHWDDSKDIWTHGSVGNHPTARFSIAPDAYFAISERGELRHFFLEADRGTEEHSRLVKKYRSYWWYLQSEQYQHARCTHRHVAVLFVTTGDRRVANMSDALHAMAKPNRADHGGKGLFLFARQDEYAVESPASILALIRRRAACRKLNFV